MAKHPLQIVHVDGRVEVTALDGHGGKPVSGTLVMAKPDEYDSLNEEELRAKLPSLGRVETPAAKDAAKKVPKRKRAPKG